jgi:hypothetical protein
VTNPLLYVLFSCEDCFAQLHRLEFFLPNDAQVTCGVSVVSYHTELPLIQILRCGCSFSHHNFVLCFIGQLFGRTTVYVAYLVPVLQPFIDVVDLSKDSKW